MPQINFSSRDAVCSSQDPVRSNKSSTTSGEEWLQRNLPWPAVWTGFFPIHHAAGVGLVAGYTTPRHLNTGRDRNSEIALLTSCINFISNSNSKWIRFINSPVVTSRRSTSTSSISYLSKRTGLSCRGIYGQQSRRHQTQPGSFSHVFQVWANI